MVTTDAFRSAWVRTFPLERGYADHPFDRGGKTNHGITEAVARAHGYTGDMRELLVDFAEGIAKAQYWDTLRLDDVAVIAPSVAEELFDTGYNAGISVAGQFLQRSLNALNHGETHYQDVTVDGVVGPVTLAALRGYVGVRGDEGIEVLLRALNCLQGARYIGIAEARLSQESFVYGWLRQRVT